MIVYFDTSVVVSFFISDEFSDRAVAFLRKRMPEIVVSDFAAAEFASVLGRLLRMKHLTPAKIRQASENFDTFLAQTECRTDIQPSDIRTAEAMLRRYDLGLRAPDAIHAAVVQRLGAELATFDESLARSARVLKLKLSQI